MTQATISQPELLVITHQFNRWAGISNDNASIDINK
jgi:hypothetical protein